MGFLGFLKKSSDKSGAKEIKEELAPPIKPDDSSASLDAPMNSNSEFPSPTQSEEPIPKPPLSDDYDMVHNDDEEQQENEMDMSSGNSSLPQDDFGSSISHPMGNASQAMQNVTDVTNVTNVTQDSMTDNSYGDIEDDIPDFDESDIEEAEQEEQELQESNQSNEDHNDKDSSDLPAFNDAEEIPDEEIDSYGSVQKEEQLFVSASSYGKVIDIIKNIKKNTRELETQVKTAKEELVQEKEDFTKVTDSMKVLQANLLLIDDKFLKR